MNRILFLIGTGGFIGSIARYLSQQIISRYFHVIFPYGTLSVNILGCFLIGVIYALSERGNIISPEWRSFLTTGFCGGFTTFSTFSYESINLVRDGELVYLSLYVAGSVIIGFGATYFGMAIMKSL